MRETKEQKMARLERKVAEQQNELKEKNKEIRKLNNEINRKGKEINSLSIIEDKEAEYKEEINRLNDEIAKQQKVINRLDHAVYCLWKEGDSCAFFSFWEGCNWKTFDCSPIFDNDLIIRINPLSGFGGFIGCSKDEILDRLNKNPKYQEALKATEECRKRIANVKDGMYSSEDMDFIGKYGRELLHDYLGLFTRDFHGIYI